MNDKKNNSTTKYLIGGVIMLVVLLGGFALFGNNSEKNSVSETISSSEENSTATEVVDNSKPANLNGSSDDVIDPIVNTPDKSPCPVGEVRNEEGECEEAGYGGSEDETDFTKILFPYAETTATGRNLKELSTVNDHMLYYRFLSFIEEKEMSVAIGYMEGCKEGCYFNNETICPKACHVPSNWREVKRFVPDDKRAFVDSEDPKDNYYYGHFNNMEKNKNTLIYCHISKKPLQLTYCSMYRVGEDVYRIGVGLHEYETAPVITLP